MKSTYGRVSLRRAAARGVRVRARRRNDDRGPAGRTTTGSRRRNDDRVPQEERRAGPAGGTPVAFLLRNLRVAVRLPGQPARRRSLRRSQAADKAGTAAERSLLRRRPAQSSRSHPHDRPISHIKPSRRSPSGDGERKSSRAEHRIGRCSAPGHRQPDPTLPSPVAGRLATRAIDLKLGYCRHV